MANKISFNTQPPEGGWPNFVARMVLVPLFQHTAARRRLASIVRGEFDDGTIVSTHSRPKAAGRSQTISNRCAVFQHTAARRRLDYRQCPPLLLRLFQHTAARRRLGTKRVWWLRTRWFQHTAARRRLGSGHIGTGQKKMFQHTAARRRLASKSDKWRRVVLVSTHSRPKAAGLTRRSAKLICWFQHTAARRRLGNVNTNVIYLQRFNTQPPEGGWGRRCVLLGQQCAVSTHSRPKAAGLSHGQYHAVVSVSTHSRPKAAGRLRCKSVCVNLFQHTAARRRLGRN